MSKRFKSPCGGGYIEFYMPTTGCGHKGRRDRRQCEFYISDTKFCSKLSNQCVGPTLCRKYVSKSKPKQKLLYVGLEINCPKRGKGILTSIDRDICTVTYETVKVQYKRTILEDKVLKSLKSKE